MDERLQKYKRIQQLHKWGLNTPQMLVVYEGDASPNSLAEVDDFLRVRDTANIRTYRLDEKKFNCPHLFQRNTDFLRTESHKLVQQGFVIMVEDFNPEHTVYNGTLALTPYGDQPQFRIDYCVGRFQTVRMVDRYIQGEYEDLYSVQERLPFPIRQIIHDGACFCPYRPVILEWSWSVIPQGRRNQRPIFWEYRDREIIPFNWWGMCYAG